MPTARHIGCGGCDHTRRQRQLAAHVAGRTKRTGCCATATPVPPAKGVFAERCCNSGEVSSRRARPGAGEAAAGDRGIGGHTEGHGHEPYSPGRCTNRDQRHRRKYAAKGPELPATGRSTCDGSMNLGATIAMPTNLGTADRGTRIWPAAGITDMRKGFEGLAAIVEAQIAQARSRSNCSSFRGCAAIAPRFSGGAATACARLPSAGSATGSHRLPRSRVGDDEVTVALNLRVPCSRTRWSAPTSSTVSSMV